MKHFILFIALLGFMLVPFSASALDAVETPQPCPHHASMDMFAGELSMDHGADCPMEGCSDCGEGCLCGATCAFSPVLFFDDSASSIGASVQSLSFFDGAVLSSVSPGSLKRPPRISA